MIEAERFMVEDLRVRIVYDPDPESPREWSNLGTMVCWHGRYNLGDKHGFRTPSDFLESVKDEPHIRLPLILYDHSGISMSTTRSYPFNCPWDSGQVGWIYVTLAQVRKEYGWKLITKKRREQIEGYLRSEVTDYDTYLTGQVYGFIVEAPPEDPDDEDDDDAWEELDSLWGIYGDDYAKEEATDSARHHLEERAKERAAEKVQAENEAAFHASAPF